MIKYLTNEIQIILFLNLSPICMYLTFLTKVTRTSWSRAFIIQTPLIFTHTDISVNLWLGHYVIPTAINKQNKTKQTVLHNGNSCISFINSRWKRCFALDTLCIQRFTAVFNSWNLNWMCFWLLFALNDHIGCYSGIYIKIFALYPPKNFRKTSWYSRVKRESQFFT